MPEVKQHQPGTPCWLDLMVPDVEKARAFYGALFGWDFQVGGPETGHYTLGLLGGRMAAGIGQIPPGAGFPAAWTVYFAVNDASATAESIKARGGQVMVGPMDVMGEGRMAIAADPTGAVFGIWQPQRHKGAGVVNEPGSMAWTEVATRDAARARDFYAAVFALEPQKMDAPDLHYWTLHKAQPAVCGVMQMTDEFPKDIPPHWMAYFAVPDTEAAVRTIVERGGAQKVPPFDTPYGRVAVVSDPFGAVFSVIKLS
jgi:predicted enzyme related to lactoylglutathione lyase